MAKKVLERALKVLVVDDNEELCESVKDVLESQGYEAACIYDGFAAVRHVKDDPPDVVLLDVRMPGINGIETFKEIKKIAPQVAAIMISGYSVDELIEEAIREGARGYLKKPLDFDRLFRLIEQKGAPPTQDKA
jgi:DNA-binding NtrC family response regulator